MEVKECSVRLLLVTASVFGLLMYNSYSAVLVSQLAVAPSTLSFPSIESVASARTHGLCVSETSFIHSMFKNKYDGQLQLQWKNIINRKPCRVGELQEDIVPASDYCEPNTVVLESPQNANLVWTHEPGSACSIATFNKRYYYSYISLLVSKHFPYTKLISQCLLELHSSGIVARLQNIWLPRTVGRSKEPLNNAVTFSHVRMVMEAYAGALLASLLILLAEIAHFFHYHNGQPYSSSNQHSPIKA